MGQTLDCKLPTEYCLLMNWTTEQVLAFAPDDGTAKRGKSTAKLSKWQRVAKNERAIWGECKGSGSKPYLTGVDLQNGPAYKCSCPVRKPPCKHVIALMLLYVEAENDFDAESAPAWMAEWLAKRDERFNKPKPKVITEEIRKAIEGENRRVAKRTEEMRTGLMDFEIWLKDLIRQGIAAVEKESYTFWKDASARLFDAKASSAAYKFESIPLLINSHPNWYEDVLAELADIYLLIQSIKRVEELPKKTKYDILIGSGHTINKKNLLLLNEMMDEYTIQDDWDVLGKLSIPHATNSKLKIQKYWLKGRTSQKFALIYEPKFFSDGFEYNLAVGTYIKAEVVFYPSNYTQRMHIKKQIPETGYLKEFIGHSNLEAFFKELANALAANPWLSDFPCMLNEVVPIIQNEQLYIIDKNETIIQVQDRDLIGWKLLALSGGNPISIFGEWTGKELIPLSAWVEDRFIEMSVFRINH